MTLDELINELSKRDLDRVVKDGFGSPHTDRGNYSNCAFDPVATPTTIGNMLIHAKSALDNTFEGYKGGAYTMRSYTDVIIGEWGEFGEPITKYHFLYWDLLKGDTHE